MVNRAEKTCRNTQHVKIDNTWEMSNLICGKTAVGGNYNSTRDIKAFYRPDFSRDKKDGGTGLGLYIVKNILDDANLEFQFKPSDLGMKFIIDFRND